MKNLLRKSFATVFSVCTVISVLSFAATAEGSTVDYAAYRETATATAGKEIRCEINSVLQEQGLTFEIDAEEGAYRFALEYREIGENSDRFTFGLQIDGEYPFTEARNLSLFRMFTNAEGGNRIDGLGNEFAPKQVPYTGYMVDYVADITRWSDEEYVFGLSAGRHTVTLVKGEGSPEIAYAIFSPVETPAPYTAPAEQSDYYRGDRVILEGEDATVKTGYWLAAKADNASLAISPNDPYLIKPNYIGSNWKTPGQTLVWETPEMQAGYYQLGFCFRQSTMIGAKVYRGLKIDGETPFSEAGAIGFGYSYNWQQSFFADEEGTPYLIYLSEGKHTISLEVTSGEIAEIRDLIKQAVAQLGDLYVDITMITGETVDLYRDYDLFAQITDMQSRLQALCEELETASRSLQKVTGQKSGSYISVINNMRQICKLMMENRYTAHRYKDEYYSKYTSLASVLYEMSDMPLDIDKMAFTAVGEKKPFVQAGLFADMAFSVKKFAVSFIKDYNNISGVEDDREALTIWVNWGRDQAQILNSLVQSNFTPKTGIAVNVQIVNASVVQAVLSGKGPDCLLQHSRSEPVNLAMRGMLYDLKRFDDCDAVLKNFHAGAELPYYYKGGLYGLPDTQQFYLMFYRTDIMKQMGLTIPETWDEFKEIAKLLTRNNLTVWMPNNTATSTAQANIGIGSINLFPTLLLQENLEIYKQDGKATNLTDSAVIVSFNHWTDFYTKLKLPRTMDFYNRFRTGTCPIGISSYTLYTTLKAAAPEIDGLWNVAQVPGTPDENGKINHTTSGGGTACSILKLSNNPENAWEFLKWWVSEETQLAYSSEVESVLGPTGRVAISNVKAFGQMEWDAVMRDTIVTALNQTAEIPEYPGSYYVSRSLYQAFWNVVENNQNTKKMLLKYAEEANNEIAHKWKQYEQR